MNLAVLHRQEFARLRLLDELDILDHPADAAIDALVRRAAALPGADGAWFSLMTASEQWVTAGTGAPQRWPRHASICGHVVSHDTPLALEDAASDMRFVRAAAVAGAPGIRGYAGVPVRARGLPLGSLCMWSASPMTATPAALAALDDLALVAGLRLDARLDARAAAAGPGHEAATPAPAPAPPPTAGPAGTLPSNAVLDAVPDLWFVLDAQGQYLQCSAGNHPSLVQPFEQLRGRRLVDGLPAPTAERVSAALARALASRQLQVVEYDLVVADGRRRHFETRVSPVADGRLLYLARDVTEERDARRDMALMQRVFESPSSLPIAIGEATDAIGDAAEGLPLVYVNPAFEALFGRPRAELLGLPFDFMAAAPTGDGASAGTALRQAVAGSSETTVTLPARRADGEPFIDEISIVPVRTGDDQTSHVIGIHRDITERLRMETALRDRQAAELANRSKSEFLSRMSHEMRTPLNAIIGFSQLMQMQPGVRIDHVNHVLEAGQQLLALVNDVLDLQQVEAGQVALKPAALALADIVAACTAVLEPLAQARSVHLQVDDMAGVVVRADESRLRQVLLTIGSNAVKYNRPAGVVRWRPLTDRGALAGLAIEDTGPGITAQQRERLFQPFERLGRETSTIAGTGLGLLLARRLTEAMGGQLLIDSTVGAGTRVEIHLPRVTPTRSSDGPARDAGPAVASAPAEPAAEPAAAADIDATGPLRLLYVEDNRINAMLFEQAIRMHTDYELRVAEDGAEALEMVREWRPDVLILDANLPGENGYEVLVRLREEANLPHAPAFMCSADAMPSDLERARRAGFRGYWTKPVDIAAVVGDLHLAGADCRVGR